MSEVKVVLTNPAGVPKQLLLQQEILYRQNSMTTPEESELEERGVFDDYVAVLQKGGGES